ncbi:MAG TPA: tetratricopeptide repeat protein, partial [Kofleriaceae bacterium]
MRRVALVLCLCAAGAGVTRAETGDWTVHRDPFDRTVVARCKAILAKNPYDSALATLVGIYRKARSVEQLAQEYREEPESWAALVVLARLAEPDHARALSAYKRAVELDDRDYRAWIAIGDASKPEAARPHYERALALSPPAPLRKAVLRKLATLPGAPDVRDRAYARLVERDPNNGTLWTERADSLAAARVFAQAVDCYTQAEALLKRDPERRLYVIAQRGLAHELAGDIDAAVADYKRAIAESPRGYYLKTELVARIIRVHTKANTLPALLREYQRAWPEKSRGHFEWTTLGQLYQATGALDAAILALQAAVAKAPDDLDTQRRLVTLLDAAGRTDDALAQLEAAAKTAPRDVKTQFQLVERYWDKDKPKLLATLGKLSRALPTNPGVHHDIGNLYIKLRRLDLATHEYELVAKLEPDDDNLLLLGDTHWDAGNQDQAVATWNWLARKRTAASYAALGNVLVEHELYEDALVAYSRAIDREPDNAELWRARGAIYEVVKRWGSAVSDTDHAVALLGAASRDAGHAARYQLVRILVTLAEMRDFSGADEANQLEDRVAQWELAFGKGDLIAGYLLAEFYGSSPNARHAAVLEQLHARVPDDAGLTLEL